MKYRLFVVVVVNCCCFVVSFCCRVRNVVFNTPRPAKSHSLGVILTPYRPTSLLSLHNCISSVESHSF